MPRGGHEAQLLCARQRLILTTQWRGAAYNPDMSSSIVSTVRRTLILVACAAPFALAQAQTAPQTAPTPSAPPDTLQNQEQASGRQNQKIENIHTEDSGAKIDEQRYGGRTESITVTPKANVPSYQVLPQDGKSGVPKNPGESSQDGNGPRVWNVLKF